MSEYLQVIIGYDSGLVIIAVLIFINAKFGWWKP